MSSTLLRALLRERHWTYGTFCKQYDEASSGLGEPPGTWPSRSQFARWLAGGVPRPRPHHCRVLEAMFPGLTVDQLFMQGSGTGLLGISSPMAAGHSGRLRPEPSSGTSPEDVPSKEDRGERRRVTLDEALCEELAMSTDESARFVRQARGAADHDLIDQLRADVEHAAARYLTQPPFQSFTPLSRLRREVFHLIDQRQRPEMLPALYRIAGQLSALLAHASLDLGQAYAAETHTRTAWLCAELASDDQLRTYTRWVQSNIAYWNGQYREAADIAHAGQRYAKNGTGLLRLASQEARAHAAAADKSSVEKSLAIAMAARETARPEEDSPGGVFRFEPGKAAYYASEARIALGGKDNYHRAVADADSALELFDAQLDGERCAEFVAAAHIDNAVARIALNDVDAAAYQLRPVLNLPSANRTLPVAQRMQQVGRSLMHPRFASSGLAADLREQVDFFSAYTATRQLPAS